MYHHAVNLMFQNRCLVEVMAGFDLPPRVKILNCMNSFLSLFQSQHGIVSSSYFWISLFEELNFLICIENDSILSGSVHFSGEVGEGEASSEAILPPLPVGDIQLYWMGYIFHNGTERKQNESCGCDLPWLYSWTRFYYLHCVHKEHSTTRRLSILAC